MIAWINIPTFQTSSKIIAEILEGLISGGTENFAPVLEKLLNELMKIGREKCIGAQPFERTESRKGYSNGFKDKMLQTRSGPLQLKYCKFVI